MNKKGFAYPFFLILVSLWWGWTLIVDFVVVPTVFQTVKDFFNAGHLGIAVFSKLNHFELVISSLLVVLTAFQIKKNRLTWPFFLMSILSFGIVMFYFSFLTPKIIALTDLWEKADKLGQIAVANISDIQQEHQFYHNIYIRLDSAKLLLLTASLALGIYRKDQLE